MSQIIAKNLNHLMLTHNIKSPTELARRVGVPQPTVFRMLVNESKDPRHSTVVQIANYFGLVPSDLTERDLSTGEVLALREATPPRREVPVLTWDNAADYRITEVREMARTVPLQRVNPSRYTFAIQVTGDAVFADTISDESVLRHIIVDPSLKPKSGDYVVAINPNTGLAFGRRLIIEGGMCYLRPGNPTFPTVEVREDELMVIGTIIELTMTKKF